ncbi:MAG: hypothetical protein Q9219_003605 [cf. Caloplaca sp. 3 TL-2023]
MVIAVSVGLVSGNYIFRPEIEDLEKQKREGALTKEEPVQSIPIKEDDPTLDHSDGSETPDASTDERPSVMEKTVNQKSATLGQTLATSLQPWDARKK